jgi:hypothetical protein
MATVGLTSQRETGLTSAKIGGIAGLGFAAGVIVQNAVLLAGSPLPGANLEDVVRFYTDSSARITIANGWVAINAAFLLTFVSVISNRLAQEPASAIWGRIAYAAGIALFAVFATATFLQIVLVNRMSSLEGERAVLGLLWDLHSAAFTMSVIALGVLLLSLSIGALATPVVPRWTAGLGVAGGVLALTAGMFSFNMIDGGPALFLGFAGFGAWVVWLITASIRLLRAE